MRLSEIPVDFYPLLITVEKIRPVALVSLLKVEEGGWIGWAGSSGL